jgi:hypothetical protein
MNLNLPESKIRPVADELPPFLRTWGNVYLAVVGYTAALIAALYLFTKVFGHA